MKYWRGYLTAAILAAITMGLMMVADRFTLLVDMLYPETGWNRNTVLTYLTRMEAKGLTRIDKDVSPHIYYAVIDRESLRKQERKSFLKRVYSGSASELIAAFLVEEKISPEERERLRAMLDGMEV